MSFPSRPARRGRGAGVLAFALLLCCALVACDAGATAPSELAPIPEPDLSSLTEAAREQLHEQRQAFESVLAEPAVEPATLAEAYGQIGRYYQAYELFSAAEPCYQNAQTLAPETFDWPYLSAHLYRAASEYEQAAQSFRRALEIDPEHLPAQVWLADLLVDLGQLDEAEALSRAVLDQDARAAPALVVLARVTAAREDPSQTVELLERARAIAPDATEIYYPLGLAYRSLGDTQAAERYLALQGRVKARFEDPLLDDLERLILSAGAALNRGTQALGEGNLELAEQEYRKAIELDPQDARGYTNLSFVLAQRGDGDGALEALQHAVELDPTSAKANFNLASLLVRFGRSREASAYFEAALAADPNYVDGHFNYANNLLRLGELGPSAEHYARVIALDPANRDALLLRGVLLLRNEDWAAAIDALEQAHAALPDDETIADSLARALSTAPDPSLRDADRALSLAEALVARERELAKVETLAMALAAAGRFAEAVDQQGKAITAARDAERPDLASGLAINLQRYEKGQIAAGPWRENDPNMPGVR